MQQLVDYRTTPRVLPASVVTVLPVRYDVIMHLYYLRYDVNYCLLASRFTNALTTVSITCYNKVVQWHSSRAFCDH